MKKLSVLILVFVIVFTFIVNAFSVNIDGVSNGDEWHDAAPYLLTESDSNCNITFGAVKVKFDNENSCVYMCFSFIDPYLEPDNQNCGVKISVNGSGMFVIDAASSPVNEDIDKYSFDAAVKANVNNEGVCEVRIGFKEGIPQNIDCDIQLIDSVGEPSNHYFLNLINEGYSETTVVEVRPTADNEDPFYNPDLLTTKTTKPKTTKQKTTRYITEKETTRKKRTTTTKPSTTKFVVPDSPMCYTGRTKAPQAATVIIEKEEIKLVTVYYYEKEVIISHVPVTVLVTENDKITSNDIITESSTITETSVDFTANENTPAKTLSAGSKYKKLFIICGAVLFALIAFSGVISLKKKKSNV